MLAWLVLAFGLPLAALTLNAVKFAGFPLGFWTTAVFVLIALATLAMVFAARAGGDAAAKASRRRCGLAGEAIGSAGVIGSVGAIAALGYDGLAFPLGLAAGLALLAMIVAPRFSLYPVQTIAGFFSARYGGVWPRRLALAITGVASVALLAADLRGGALAVQGAFATDYRDRRCDHHGRAGRRLAAAVAVSCAVRPRHRLRAAAGDGVHPGVRAAGVSGPLAAAAVRLWLRP